MKQEPVWLVWSMSRWPSANPSVSLRAVDTSREMAITHRDMIKNGEPNQERVWIEETLTNHCMGHKDVVISGALTKRG